MNFNFLFLYIILFFAFQNTHAIAQTNSTTTLPGARTWSDIIGEFNCTLPIDYLNNPFTIRRAAWTALDEVVTFGTPVVGDFIPGNGKTEVLILKKTESNKINPGVGGTTPEWNWITGNPPRQYVTRNIIVYTYGGEGAGGLVKEMEIPTPDLNFEGPSPFLIAKVPGYTNPLVIVATSSTLANAPTDAEYDDRLPLTSRLVAYDFLSTTFKDYRWISSDKYGANVPDSPIPGVKYRSGSSPGIANFDLTGKNQYPGVYVFNEIFSLDPAKNANNKVFNGGNLGQGISVITPGGTSTFGGSQSVTVAADVIPGNNTLELVCGNTVYEIDQNYKLVRAIQLKANINGLPAPDGFTSIANIDLTNNRLDIVVTTSRGDGPDSRLVYVWTIEGGNAKLIASRNLVDANEVPLAFHSATINTGLAFIGDIDGNGRSEIGVTSPLRLSMLSYDGTTTLKHKWPPLITNDESGHTLITMFDFNQDGSQELVYRDENLLRIIGGDGKNIVTIPVRASTAGDGPVIADLSGDGEADIIVTDSQDIIYDWGNRYPRTPDAKLVVFKSNGFPWAPARGVWNQYAYFSFNVNDDLTIPVPQQNHGLEHGAFFPTYDSEGCLIADRRPFNSFLVQRTLYTEGGCFSSGIPIMDAKVELLSAKFLCLDAGKNRIEVEFTVSNEGDAELPSGVKIKFSLGTTVIDNVTVGENVPAGASITKTITINSSKGDSPPLLDLSAIINPAINGVYDFPECNYDGPVTIPVIPRPVFVVDKPDPICEGSPTGIFIQVTNSTAGSVDDAVVKWYKDAANGTLITNGLTVNGTTYTIDSDFSLQIDNLPAAATPYKFYLVDECSNLPAREVLVIVDPSPNIAFEVEDVSCFGNDTGFISNITGDRNYISYSLDDGATFITSAQLKAQTFSAGNYSVTVRASINPPAACIADFDFTIGEPDPFEFSNPSQTEPLCEPGNGAIFWNILGGNPSAAFPFYTYNLTRNGTAITGFTVIDENGKNAIKGVDGGDYVLLATDSKGCTVSQSFTLVPQQDPGFFIEDAAAICFGEDAVFDVDMTNPGVGMAIPTYEWGKVVGGVFTPIIEGENIDGGVAGIENNGQRLKITGLPANAAEYNYQVRISGENTCDQVPLDTKIKVNPLPQLEDPVVESVSCFNGTDGRIVIAKSLGAGSDNYSYFLAELNLTKTNGIFENLSAGTYTITVTNTTTACELPLDPITITQPEPLTLSGQILAQPSCEEDTGSYSIDLQGGTAPYTFVLTLGSTVLETLSDFSGSNYGKGDLAPGSYSFTITDANSCSITDAFTLVNDPKQAIGLVVNDVEICEGEIATIQPTIDTAGNPRTVSWFYDAQGLNQIAAGADPSDAGVSYQLDGENLIVSGLKTDKDRTYYLEVIGNLYCPVMEAVNVVISPPLNVNIDVPEGICFGEGVTVTVDASGGDGVFEYSLNNGNYQSSNVFQNTAVGTHTVSVKSANGCSYQETFVVEGPTAPISLGDDVVIIGTTCNEDNGIIQNVNVLGGWGSFNVEWRKDNPTSGTLVGTQLPEVNNLSSGTFFLIVTDEKGCEAIFEFVVQEQPFPDLVIPDQIVCEGPDIILTPTQTVSGASTTDLIWYKDAAGTALIQNGPDPSVAQINYTIDEESILLIEGLPAGEYTYYLKISCNGEIRPVNVTVNASPNPVLEKTDLSCFGIPTGKIIVTANGNPDFRYSINGAAPVTQSAVEAMDLSAGTYEIEVSQIGTTCLYTETITLSQPEEFIFEGLEKRDPTCGSDDGMIKFSVFGGVKDYVITINNQAIDTFNFTESNGVYTVEDLALGEYDIVINDANACQIEELAAFALVDENIISVQSKNLEENVCEGEVAVLTPDLTVSGTVNPTKRWFKDAGLTEEITGNYDPAGTGVMYEIDPATGQLTVYNLPLGSVTYYLEVSDPLICTVSSKADVTVTPFPQPVFDKVDVLCFGEQTGKITVTAGEDTKLRYSINGGTFLTQSELEALDLLAGDYIIDYKHEDTACEGSQTLEIVEPDALVFEALNLTNPACGIEDGSIVFKISGGVPAYNIAINNLPLSDYDFTENNGEYTVSNLPLGVYDIAVTDENGCRLNELSAFSLVDDSENAVQSKNLAVTVCEGEIAVLLPDLTITGSVNPNLKWFSDATLLNGITDNYDPAGTGVMYEIDPATGQLTVYNLPLGSVTYYLEVSDPLICTVSSKADLSIFGVPSPEFVTFDNLCYGEESGKIELTSATDPLFRFSINGEDRITLDQLEARNFAAGQYVVETFFENSDCGNLQTLEIKEPEPFLLEVLSTNDPVCGSSNGSLSFEVNGGTESYIILINNNPIDSYNPIVSGNSYQIDDLVPGIYTIIIQDAKGCIIEDSVALENRNLLPISAEDLQEEICEGSPITFRPVIVNPTQVFPKQTWYSNSELTAELVSDYDPTGTGVMYEINPSSGNLTVYNLAAGNYTYYLVLTDSEICDIVTEATVVISEVASTEFEVDDILCHGDESGKIRILSAGSPDLRYILNGGNQLTKPELETLSFVAGIYTIETIDVNAGCPDIQILEIKQPEALILEEVSFTNPSCDEDNGDLVIRITGGVESYDILINGAPIADYSYAEEDGRYVINQLSPGIYNIMVTDANGCILDGPAAFELVNFDASSITAYDMEAVVCEGNPLSFVPDFDAGTVNPIKRWFKNTAQTQEITSNYDPTKSGVMYQIDPATGELSVYNLPYGQHTFYLQLSDPLICTFVAKAEGIVNQGIDATISATPEICFGGADGSVSITDVTGGSGDYEFSLDNATWQSNPSFENLVAGTYNVYIRDVGSEVPCVLITSNIQVEGPASAIAINDDVIIINASCDLPNGSISNIQLSGGWGNYTIEWRADSPTGTLITGDQNGASNLSPGKYFLLVRDEEGCEEVFEFEITEQDKPNFEPVLPNDICAQENITLSVINNINGSSSTDFSWYKNPNQTDPISVGPDALLYGVSYETREELNSIHLDIVGLPAGNYTYYFVAECTGQEISISFEVFAIPDPDYFVLDISCFAAGDGKIAVSNDGGSALTYSIDGGNFISQSELEALEFNPGEYALVAQNSSGCLGPIKTVKIFSPELLEMEIINTKNSACGSDDGRIEIAIKGGTPAYSLVLIKDGVTVGTIQTGGPSYTFTNLASGNFRIQLIDDNDCFAELEEPVTIADGPTEIIIQQNHEICEGETVELKPIINPLANNPVFTWYWDQPNDNNEISNNQVIGNALYEINSNGELTVSGLDTGTAYTIWVAVSGAGICEGDLKEITIQVSPTPVFKVDVSPENCFGEGGGIRLLPEGTQGGILYSINNGIFQAYTDNEITGLLPGHYTIKAKNEAECVYDLPETIEISGPAEALTLSEIVVNDASCSASDGSITGLISGGTPEYSISLLDPNGNVIFGPLLSQNGNINLDNLAPGTYSIRVEDSKGCFVMDQGIVVNETSSTILANDQIICEGEIAVIQATLDPTGNSPAFNWYYDQDLVNPVQETNVPDQLGATYTISSNGEMRIAGLKGRPLPYSYFIMVDGQGVCPPEVKEVKVTVHPLPTLRVSNPSIVCDPTQTVNLTEFIEGFNPSVFDYRVVNPKGNVLRLEDLYGVSGTGSYTVQSSYKGSQCWTPIDRIAIIISDIQLIANFQYIINIDGVGYTDTDVQIEDMVNFEDKTQGKTIIWNWDFGDGNFSSERNPVHQYFEPGTYVVKLTTVDRFGCTAVIEKIIRIYDDYLIIIPNAFTPDGVINKHFKPKFRGIAAMKFYIFNTWGDLIFETDNMESLGWDGTLKGINVPNGNYVYKGHFRTRTGIEVTRTGVFTLIR